MVERPLYSVVIPTYNRAGVLPEALESVFAQRLAGVQVVVVDDGSTDETRQVVASYGDRVLYLSQENRGSCAARNLGLTRAEGDIIGFLDSDDVWLPGKMERELELFEKTPEADVIVSDCEAWLEGELSHPSWFAKNGVVLSSDGPHFMPLHPPVWAKRSLFATSCIAMRRRALELTGFEPFDDSFRSHGDWDFEIRLLRYCKVLVLPRILTVIRRFNDGTRGDRPTPGHAPTPTQTHTALLRRLKVVERALMLEGWPADAVAGLNEARGEIIGLLDEHRGGRETTST